METATLLNVMWVLLATAMVLFMQAGFAALESGSTRSKNTINVAIKNLVDLCITSLFFWAVGYGMMFGLSQAGWIGGDSFFFSNISDPSAAAFFLFQCVFCGTAATIVSGAIAERMTFSAYILVSIVVSVLIYPIFGHWAWGGANIGQAVGFLNSKGFVDFAGSTVVHSIGGWTALAAVIVIGARIGRFDADGKVNKINPSSIPLMVMGAFILWFGWIGFNGGSTLAMNAAVPGIVFNTIIAACAGGTFGLFFSWWREKIAVCEPLINGVLAGLVAITAGCHAVTPLQAIIIGTVGAAVMMTIEHLMLRAKLDDAVGAVPVHLGAGIWGTLAVGIFGNLETLATGLTRGEQILMQASGILVAGLWAFPLAFVSLKLINKIVSLRVTAEQEYDGLNVAEHGATTEIMDFFKVLDKQEETGDLSLRAPVEPFTEVGQIAKKYNKVLEKVETESVNLKKAKRDINSILESVSEGLIVIKSDGSLSAESSRAALQMLQVSALENKKFEDVLFPYGDKNNNRDVKTQITNLINTAFALFLPEQFPALASNCARQLRFPLDPDCKEFRLYRLSFSTVIENESISKVIIVLTDETELADLRNTVAGLYKKLADNLKHITSIMKDEVNRDSLRVFLEDSLPAAEAAARSLNRLDINDVADLFRKVHTIKGGARVFKLDFLQHFAHSVEEKLDYLRSNEDAKLSDDESREMIENMKTLRDSLGILLELDGKNSSTPKDPTMQWQNFLRSMGQGAATISKEIKKDADFHFASECTLAGRDIGILSTCLIHMLRNSLDHGVETPEERKATNKSPTAKIQVGLRMHNNNQVEVLVRDDGGGINFEKVLLKAKEKGIIITDSKTPSLKLICDIISQPGFTSKDEVSLISGRGVGMDAVASELKSLGGELSLIESSNHGTLFKLTWQAQDALSKSTNLESFSITSEKSVVKAA